MRVRVTKAHTKIYGARRAAGDIVDVPGRDARTLKLLGYAEDAPEPAPVGRVAQTRALNSEEASPAPLSEPTPPSQPPTEAPAAEAAESVNAPPTAAPAARRRRYENRQLTSED